MDQMQINKINGSNTMGEHGASMNGDRKFGELVGGRIVNIVVVFSIRSSKGRTTK